jgi:hypothetical protein
MEIFIFKNNNKKPSWSKHTGTQNDESQNVLLIPGVLQSPQFPNEIILYSPQTSSFFCYYNMKPQTWQIINSSSFGSKGWTVQAG